MKNQSSLYPLVFGIVLLFTITKNFAAAPVQICGEPWAPFLYETAEDSQGNKKVAGLHLENFRLLSELTGLDFKLNVLPWKRCLHEVEFHKPGDQEVAIDASYNDERYEKYYLVGPIYDFGTAVFYSRTKFPDGPPYSDRFGRPITTIADMQDFSICGLLGWNYESYYLKHGMPRSVKVDQTPAGMQGVFNMVSRQRCDVVEVHPEIVAGEIVIGKLDMPKDITCRKLQGDLQNFYMMVSRKSPRAEELVTRLSTAFIKLKSTGKLRDVQDKGVLPDSEFARALQECM